MNELRISLVVIGILVIVAVYAAARLNSGRRERRRGEVRVEPTVSAGADHRIDEPEFEVRASVEAPDNALLISASGAQPIPAFVLKKTAEAGPKNTYAPKATDAPRRVASSTSTPAQVITLNVVARPDVPFRGDAIRKALAALGLTLDERGLFHYFDTDADGKRATVFLVANMLKPGTFELSTMDALTTRGLSLFMQVPGPLSASEGFDLMLERAGSIAVRLGGTMCDDQRVPLNPQRAREIRERLLSSDFAHAMPHYSGTAHNRNQ